MTVPPSPLFTPIRLTDLFNAERAHVPEPLRLAPATQYGYGSQTFLGIPFELGLPDRPNVLLLDKDAACIDLENTQATYVIFLHAVEDRKTVYQEGFADSAISGHELGQPVSDYTLEYEDGSRETIPILRRIAIQQSHVTWGVHPFAAVPVHKPLVFASATDYRHLERPAPRSFGASEVHLEFPLRANRRAPVALRPPQPPS